MTTAPCHPSSTGRRTWATTRATTTPTNMTIVCKQPAEPGFSPPRRRLARRAYRLRPAYNSSMGARATARSGKATTTSQGQRSRAITGRDRAASQITSAVPLNTRCQRIRAGEAVISGRSSAGARRNRAATRTSRGGWVAVAKISAESQPLSGSGLTAWILANAEAIWR